MTVGPCRKVVRQTWSCLSLSVPRMGKNGLQGMPGNKPTLNRLQSGDALCIPGYAELQDAPIPERDSQRGLLQGQRHAHGRIAEPDAARLSPRDLAILTVDRHDPASRKGTLSLHCHMHCCRIGQSSICCHQPSRQWSGNSCSVCSQSPPCSSVQCQRLYICQDLHLGSCCFHVATLPSATGSMVSCMQWYLWAHHAA